ncbi:MAG: FliI/YscN family ATPase [Deltaproteobacteria bacterium]|nr:FliI/YscN family ATPase [Deltaproteobacteria bacterium]
MDGSGLLGEALARVRAAATVEVEGFVTEVVGCLARATVPNARVGDLCEIGCGESRLSAEIVGFRGEEALLMPLGDLAGVGPDSMVRRCGAPLDVAVGDDLLGRVVNGLGTPIDGGPPVGGACGTRWSVDRAPPDPLSRRRVSKPFETGIRAIDALCTLGEGQRMGLFAGAGVGKSTLLGQIARFASSDVNVVALVGERGREVREFVEEALGDEGLRRSVVVVATSDEPPLVRLRSAFVATAIAEYFRDAGKRVLFMLDSVTRLARAQREVGLAAGEPPARQGYPPSVFSMLPRLLERTGNSEAGSITAIYTVLVAGGDMEEPIADEVRGILDGHIVLSRALAERNHWPAIDVLQSLSRVMTSVASAEHLASAGRVRALLAAYEKHRDLIVLGAYARGTDRKTDEAIERIHEIESFLTQPLDRPAAFDVTLTELARGIGEA